MFGNGTQVIVFNLLILTSKKKQMKGEKHMKKYYKLNFKNYILITLYIHFKKLYIVKIAEEYRKDLALAMQLKPNQLFLTTKYKMQAKYCSKQEIEKIMEEFINLDANYKVGLIDINIGLEAILCRYCS